MAPGGAREPRWFRLKSEARRLAGNLPCPRGLVSRPMLRLVRRPTDRRPLLSSAASRYKHWYTKAVLQIINKSTHTVKLANAYICNDYFIALV